MNVLIFLLISCIVAVASDEDTKYECTRTDQCKRDECCVALEKENIVRCEKLRSEGDICTTLKYSAIKGSIIPDHCVTCKEGLNCIQDDNSSLSNTYYCRPSKQPAQKKTCNDLKCGGNECCVQPTDEDARCQAQAADGEVCQPAGRVHTKACSCVKGTRCTQKDPNTETGVCDKDSGEKCGDFSCPLNYCCIYSPDGPPSCHPLPKEGEVCEASNKVHTKFCNCERGTFCVQKDSNNNETGVCETVEKYDRCAGGLYCPNDKCCLSVPGEAPSCQPLGKKGDVCKITLNANFSACPCQKDLYCKYKSFKNSTYNTRGECIDPTEEGQQCYTDKNCGEQECCPVDINSNINYCHPLGDNGDYCAVYGELYCKCKSGMNCYARNESIPYRGICLREEQVSGPCGQIYCLKEECCVQPSDGGSPYCQPLSNEGEICATSKEAQVNACTCTEGLNCIPEKPDDKSQGVCTVPNQEKMQSKKCGNRYGYGYNYCKENQCCVTYGNGYGYSHCVPLSGEGQPCNPNPAIQTYSCGCAKGLSCTTDPNIRNPTVGVCTNPNKNQPIQRQNPNLNLGVGIGGGLQG